MRRVGILLLVLGLLGCSRGALVELSLRDLPEETDRLQVQLARVDASRAWPPHTLQGAHTLVRIRLPSDESGPLRLSVSALSSRGCLLAESSSDLPAPAPGALTLQLQDRRSEGCSLRVYVSGTGSGTISSPELAIQRISPYLATARSEKADTIITLTASPDSGTDSYFAGWAGACKGLNECRVNLGAGATEVRATFAPLSRCLPSGFCWHNPRPQGADLFAAFGFATDDIWTAGALGTVLRYSGRDWVSESVPREMTATLRGIWGSGPRDVWFVGDQGTVLRYRGEQLEQLAVVSEDLRAVSGSGPDEVWFVGAGGRVLRWHEGALGVQESPDASGRSLNAVWVGAAGDVWLGGAGGLWHWDGSSYQAIDTKGVTEILTLWGSGGPADPDREIWFGGVGGLRRFKRGIVETANFVLGLPIEEPAWVYALWGRPADPSTAARATVFASLGSAILQRNGELSFSKTELLSSAFGSALWGTTSTDVWVAGYVGSLTRWDGRAFHQSLSGQRTAAVGLTKLTPGEAWIGTAEGYLVLDRPQGQTVKTRYEAGIWNLHSALKDTVWIAVNAFAVYRVQSSPWESIEFNPIMQPFAVWADELGGCWVSGPDGRVAYIPPGQDSNQKVPSTVAMPGKHLYALQGDRSGNLWAAGLDATLLRYDGTRWTAVPSGADPSVVLRDLWVGGPQEVWAVGANPDAPFMATVVRFDGTRFNVLALPGDCSRSTALFGIWGSGPRDVWIVGETYDPSCAPAYHFDGSTLTPFRGLPNGLSRIRGRVSADGRSVELQAVGKAGYSLVRNYEVPR